ncbi:hypothetical protein GCM10022224_034930 [Nonomuraea antimicrobica]|uniref:Peptidase C51 domain-containing protein n=1 Tax=Nonomuraea antimicrobica TaxID=561173 RepID=A0ABP7BR47_9ACTN
MTPEIQKYIELLESQLGYSEKSDSYTKFGEWYGKNVEFDADYSSAPWCDMYLSWAAHKLGYEEWIGQFAWTVAHAKWFKKQDAWGKTPEVGAFVFYDWSGSNDVDKIDHIGVVTKIENGRIFTIEGNIDGGVAKRKERDTSKVVGYGYPERIKDRLDEAAAEKKAKEAEKQAEMPGEQVGHVGTLQLPGEGLNTLIPRNDGTRPAQGPLVAGQGQDRIQSQTPAREESPSKGQTEGQTPEEAQGRAQAQAPAAESPSKSQASSPSGRPATSSDSTSTTGSASAADSRSAAPSPSASASAPAEQSPQATASAAPGTVKKGKHAKPTTADTEEATGEPLPTHADATATGPLPAVNTPTLVGSALVAALALLAVAKTRRLRLGASAKPAEQPVRPSRAKGRRRRRRFAEVPVTVPTAVPTAVPVTAAPSRPATVRRTAVELPDTAERLAAATALRSLTASAAAHPTTPRHEARPAGAGHAGAGNAGAGHAWTNDGTRDRTHDGARPASGRDAAARRARHRKMPLDTRPFDLATDAAPRHRTPADHRPGPVTGPFTPAFDHEPYEPDFDGGRFRFTDETGPLEVVLDTGPLQRVVDTGSFERILIPGASSTFDAFSPPRTRRGDVLDSPGHRGSPYRGRRRRRSADEPAAFQHDTPLRGRRHRRMEDERLLVAAAPSGRGRHRA